MQTSNVNAAEAPFSNISVQRRGTELTIEIQWGRAIGIMILSVSTLSFLMPFYLLNFSQLVLPPMIIGGLALSEGFLVIFSLCLILNKTRITVNSLQVKIASGPLWFGAGKTVNLSDIENFAVMREITSAGQGHVGIRNQVDVILKSGRPIKVCATRSMHQSRYIKKQLETFLGIENDRDLDNV